MVQSQCPVCGEVGGFHNKQTHDGLLMPADSLLPSGWLKQYQEEKKYWEQEAKERQEAERAKTTKLVSDLTGISPEEIEELGGICANLACDHSDSSKCLVLPKKEGPMVTISQDVLIQLVASALRYDTRLPYGAVPTEVLPLLPEGWLKKYWED